MFTSQGLASRQAWASVMPACYSRSRTVNRLQGGASSASPSRRAWPASASAPAKKSNGGSHQALAKDVAGITRKVIVDALDSASIPTDSLTHKRVCVFYGGPGMLPEI